jgi:hypothetical protein
VCTGDVSRHRLGGIPLTCIQENTGLATETLRRALPATADPICSLNATGLGRLLGMKAKDTNQHLAACGLQIRNPRRP